MTDHPGRRAPLSCFSWTFTLTCVVTESHLAPHWMGLGSAVLAHGCLPRASAEVHGKCGQTRGPGVLLFIV